jgi:CRISPR-associated protein Cst1
MLRVYTKDWYYNAGIVGFLYVLGDGEVNIEKIVSSYQNSMIISENYLEFDSSILDVFFEKYKKLAFVKLFDLDSYKERLNRLKIKVDQITSSTVPKKLLNDTALSGKVVNRFIQIFCNISFENSIIQGRDNFLNDLNNILNILNHYNHPLDLIDNNNSEFIDYFLKIEVSKKLCNYKNIEEYIKVISQNNFANNTEDSQKCGSCLAYKKEYDFSNAISQIVGFNSDNSNWIWGFKSSKVKICALCALIYSCALHGMIIMKRKVDNEYKNFLYFLNRNTDIKTMYNSVMLFKTKFEKAQNQDKPFYILMNELIYKLVEKKASDFLENINFIEIAENDFGGQSTKSYNVYNYNVTPELAKFIVETDQNKIPKGYYIQDNDKNVRKDIYEEILRKTINLSICYTDLNNYFNYYIKNTAHYNIYNVMIYILKYIKYIKGGFSMDDFSEIVNKGYYNGKDLAQRIETENKIKGIAYQLLNDLKIGDRYAFIDKYTRLSMAYGIPIKLGSNKELVDIDNFMQFGYAFINGLLSNFGQNNQQENNQQEE